MCRNDPVLNNHLTCCVYKDSHGQESVLQDRENSVSQDGEGISVPQEVEVSVPLKVGVPQNVGVPQKCAMVSQKGA